MQKIKVTGSCCGRRYRTSIAGILLTTEAVVSDIGEEKEAPAMPHGSGMGGMM